MHVFIYLKAPMTVSSSYTELEQWSVIGYSLADLMLHIESSSHT